MIDITTASSEELAAELDRVCEEGMLAADLYAYLDPFTKAGREAESAMTKLRIRRQEILDRLRSLRAAS